MLVTAAWLAADRFLIEHVEVSNVSAAGNTVMPARTFSQKGTGTSSTGTPADGGTSDESASSEAPSGTANQASAATWDDWHYTSDTLSVSIRKVTTGSGKNTVTYFIADVTVADAAKLLSAFAKDSFGTNIIE